MCVCAPMCTHVCGSMAEEEALIYNVFHRVPIPCIFFLAECEVVTNQDHKTIGEGAVLTM